MRLACPRGNINGSHPLVHRFTAGEVEQLVYALSGAYTDAMTATDMTRAEGDLPEDVEPCPLEVLRSWRNPDMYAEHIEARVEQRRSAGVA